LHIDDGLKILATVTAGGVLLQDEAQWRAKNLGEEGHSEQAVSAGVWLVPRNSHPPWCSPEEKKL